MALFDGRLLPETLLAFAMIALLGLVLRWTFSPGRGPESLAWPHREPEDFGLLTPVAIVESPTEAHRLRETLAVAGVKATTTVGRDGRHRVLVFANELDRARRVAGPSN